MHTLFSKVLETCEVSEFDYIVGTSGSPAQLDRTLKARSYHHPASGGDLISTPDLLKELVCMAKGSAECSRSHIRVLLVFGREMTGLHNDELHVCDRLMMIPTLPFSFTSPSSDSINPSDSSFSSSESTQLVRSSSLHPPTNSQIAASSNSSTSTPSPAASFSPVTSPYIIHNLANAPSLNLSHAVAVVLYALNQQLGEMAVIQLPGEKAAMSSHEREILHAAFATLRQETSRKKAEPKPDDLALFSIRRALDRANLSQQEYKHFMGLIATANRILQGTRSNGTPN